MANWTNITDEVLEPGKPIRSVDTIALRDNPVAIAEGASGAPRIGRLALDKELQTMLIYGTLLNEPKWYLSSTTVNLAPNVTHMIMVIGSGGSGAVRRVSSLSVSSGNGGGVAIKFVTPSSTLGLTLTIGAGGASVERTTNGTSNGNAGAQTTVTGTGVNVVVPGANGGIANTDFPWRNAANSLPTGGDLIYPGGRSVSIHNGAGSSGSSIFDAGGLCHNYQGLTGNILAYNISGIQIYDAGASPYYGMPSSVDLTTVVSDQLERQERFAGSAPNAPSMTLLQKYRSQALLEEKLKNGLYRTNLFSLLFPSGFGGVSQSSSYNANATGAFIGGTGIFTQSTAFTAEAQCGGIGAGGGSATSTTAVTLRSGAGGPGAVAIWSFVNG